MDINEMNLAQVRYALDVALREGDEAGATELIIRRDELRAQEVTPEPASYEQMLDYLHG